MKINQALAITRHIAQARWRWSQLNQSNLAAYHDQRMLKIMRHALHYSAFYREHWRGHNLADWRNLPLINKSLMMEHFSTFNTLGISRDQAFAVALRAERERDFSPTLNGMTVGLSSGTSGHRGIFLLAPAEQTAWAGMILARMLNLGDLPTSIAFFLRSNSNLYEQVGSRLIDFRYFDLMQPLEQSISELNQHQPKIIIGPPSLLHMLAQELGASLKITPQRVISVAEVLEPQDQTALQACFGVNIEQIYQCTEGFIAASCAHGSLHVQEDSVVLQTEPLDDQRVQPIVTDLWRKAQPIVRYRLNDVLTLSKTPCACGSDWRVITSIEGRSDDVFLFPTANGMRPVFPDTIRRMILLCDDINDYQAIQRTDGALELHLQLPDHADWAEVTGCVERTVKQILADYECFTTHLEILPNLVERPAGAKRRRVWRE